ncbi:MAG TPA: CsiV family protein [Steroidobacter sp.]|jgi:hypothetical protein|nr:CsiV family protein [Steroidobacteraceae bacterium]HLS82796.1 CsiV family protein [Steroidobacter sp.]
MNTRCSLPAGRLFSPRARRWRALLSACTLLALSAASAQELQSYDVELVIFRHLSDHSTPEHWETEAASGERAAIPDDSPFSVSTPPPPPAPESFPALPASRQQLTAVQETLRRSRDYRPIAHIGWTQPGYGRNDARFLPVATLAPAASGLGGQIALTRGRYLHLTLDLTFAPADAPGRQYVLRQSRRMRSNERHYIDHPKFGVIALITPVKAGQ